MDQPLTIYRPQEHKQKEINTDNQNEPKEF